MAREKSRGTEEDINIKSPYWTRRIEELAGLPPFTDKRTHIRRQQEIQKLKKKGAL